MTLKLTLKPGEAVLIGTMRLTVVSKSTCTVVLDGDAPVMRAGDCVDETEATEPLSRFRYVLQEIYLRNDLEGLRTVYAEAASRLVAARPNLAPMVERAGGHLLVGEYWEAVRLGRLAARRQAEQQAA